jgi:DNA-binding IclR family transcriptional regulator
VIRHMRDQPMTVRDIVDATGQSPDAVARLLNALYLQSGLIVSRTSPRISDSWLAGLGLRRRDW